jgi:hypothetical protein
MEIQRETTRKKTETSGRIKEAGTWPGAGRQREVVNYPAVRHRLRSMEQTKDNKYPA